MPRAKWMTVAELAKYFDVSKTAIGYWIKKYDIPYRMRIVPKQQPHKELNLYTVRKARFGK